MTPKAKWLPHSVPGPQIHQTLGYHKDSHQGLSSLVPECTCKRSEDAPTTEMHPSNSRRENSWATATEMEMQMQLDLLGFPDMMRDILSVPNHRTTHPGEPNLEARPLPSLTKTQNAKCSGAQSPTPVLRRSLLPQGVFQPG